MFEEKKPNPNQYEVEETAASPVTGDEPVETPTEAEPESFDEPADGVPTDEPVPETVALKVTENRVLIEVENPMVKHLVIELVESEFLVVLMEAKEIDLFVINCNASET